MIDPFGRRITYLRLSLTDRCNLRCTYCMPERMRFLPRAELLDVDELERLCVAFIRNGVRKIRLTGGEPLVRAETIELVRRLSPMLATGALDEVTMTTNGILLAQHASTLAALGVRRINVSLDSIDPETYSRVTRGGVLAQAIEGIDAAFAAGIAVKINAVALAEENLDQLVDLTDWAHRRGASLTVIEVMPMGDTGEDRIDQFVPVSEVRWRMAQRWNLTDTAMRTGGPARYVRTDAGGIIGFISPLTQNFCGGCNRVRVTCTGQMFMCLGGDADADLRTPLRASADDAMLDQAILRGIAKKPERHAFVLPVRGAEPAVMRTMSVTGG